MNTTSPRRYRFPRLLCARSSIAFLYFKSVFPMTLQIGENQKIYFQAEVNQTHRKCKDISPTGLAWRNMSTSFSTFASGLPQEVFGVSCAQPVVTDEPSVYEAYSRPLSIVFFTAANFHEALYRAKCVLLMSMPVIFDSGHTFDVVLRGQHAERDAPLLHTEVLHKLFVRPRPNDEWRKWIFSTRPSDR